MKKPPVTEQVDLQIGSEHLAQSGARTADKNKVSPFLKLNYHTFLLLWYSDVRSRITTRSM